MVSKKKIVYIGIDVDEKSFHVASIIWETGEFLEFKCKADHGVLSKRIEALFKDKYAIRLCYEACSIGYSLCRFLRRKGIHCDVIAPSLIPVKTGVRVKTDRLDAAKLAEYYAKGLLTPIYIPDETDEEVRDIFGAFFRYIFSSLAFSPASRLALCPRILLGYRLSRQNRRSLEKRSMVLWHEYEGANLWDLRKS